jgi:hypothetical protein
MKQITVRIDDPEVEKALRRKARESGKSLNRVVLELIQGGVGLAPRKKKPAGESLREFAGTMTDEEARELEEAIQIFEEIDEEMWK